MVRLNFYYIFLCSFFTTFLLIPPISRLAVGMGILDRPDVRKLHTSETARLGGIAIFFALLLSILLFGEFDQQCRGFMAGAVVIFLTGLADDLSNLRARNKFLGQIFAALMAVVIGQVQLGDLGNLFGTGKISLGIFAIPVTAIAIVGITNAINLLDGLDGLAAGVSAIALTAFCILALSSQNLHLLVYGMALLGALIGFLKFNTYPARIFMGDSGSLLIGYSLGCFAVLLATESRDAIPAAVPLLILAIPVIDTLYVMGRRIYEGRGPFRPDRTHIHHRFLDLGAGHRGTVIFIYVFSYLLATLAIIGRQLPDYILLILLAIAYPLFYHLLRTIGILYEREKTRRTNSQRASIGSVLRRRAGTVAHLLKRLVNYLIIAALFLGTLLQGKPTDESALVGILLLLLTLSLVAMARSWGHIFLQFVLYFDGAYIIYQMENLGRYSDPFGISLNLVSHGIFFFLLLVICLKALIRFRTIRLFNSPLDYLIFFIVISVPLLPRELVAPHHLLTVAGKSIILFAAYKILMREVEQHRRLVFITLVVLLTISFKGLF